MPTTSKWLTTMDANSRPKWWDAIPIPTLGNHGHVAGGLDSGMELGTNGGMMPLARIPAA